MQRLKKHIISNLAKNIKDHLKKIDDIKIQVDEKTIEEAIFNIIQEDMEIEENIEEEAKKILEEHKTSIDMRSNVSYRELLLQSKRIIAKQKGFIL